MTESSHRVLLALNASCEAQCIPTTPRAAALCLGPRGTLSGKGPRLFAPARVSDDARADSTTVDHLNAMRDMAQRGAQSTAAAQGRRATAEPPLPLASARSPQLPNASASPDPPDAPRDSPRPAPASNSHSALVSARRHLTRARGAFRSQCDVSRQTGCSKAKSASRAGHRHPRR